MVSRGGSTPAPAAFAHYASKPLPEKFGRQAGLRPRSQSAELLVTVLLGTRPPRVRGIDHVFGRVPSADLSAAMLASGPSPSRYTNEPATTTVAPACATCGALTSFTPPSTSSSQDGLRASSISLAW